MLKIRTKKMLKLMIEKSRLVCYQLMEIQIQELYHVIMCTDPVKSKYIEYKTENDNTCVNVIMCWKCHIEVQALLQCLKFRE